MTKLFATVGREYTTQLTETTEANGYVNQSGLSRKVGFVLVLVCSLF